MVSAERTLRRGKAQIQTSCRELLFAAEAAASAGCFCLLFLAVLLPMLLYCCAAAITAFTVIATTSCSFAIFPRFCFLLHHHHLFLCPHPHLSTHSLFLISLFHPFSRFLLRSSFSPPFSFSPSPSPVLELRPPSSPFPRIAFRLVYSLFFSL